MYRRSKKRRNKNKDNSYNQSVHSMNDITVQEVANNPKAVGSRKKGNFSRSNLTQLKQATAIQESHRLEDAELEHWYDRDLEDFDELEGLERVELTPAEEALEKNGDGESYRGGLVYPADLWYILGDHIDPEDIGLFSALCKGALHVTNSIAFWRKLYLRYWRSDVSLPHHLQPFSIKYSDHGLRTKVICALYRMYPLFQQRNKSCQLNWETSESSNLIGSTCQFVCNQGRVGSSSSYCHYIKFSSHPTPQEQNARNALVSNPGLWANHSAGEVMLRLTCPLPHHFSSEEIMGLQLTSISLSVAAKDMCYNRLKMEFVRTFDPKVEKKRRSGSRVENNTVVSVMKPLIGVSVLDWWHPLFHDSFQQQQLGSSGPRRGARGANVSLWDA